MGADWIQAYIVIVKLTCPENQSLIRRRLEYWKHKDLPATSIYITCILVFVWENMAAVVCYFITVVDSMNTMLQLT